MNAPSTGSFEDRIAIADVTIAYCWALDTRQWSALEDVFLPDATADLAAPTLHGVGEIQARVRRALEPLDDSQHMVSNHQVTFDDTDRARCRCYLHAQHTKRGIDGGDNLVVGGRYEDQLVRTADGWRIVHRTLVPMWREGNPKVLGR